MSLWSGEVQEVALGVDGGLGGEHVCLREESIVEGVEGSGYTLDWDSN